MPITTYRLNRSYESAEKLKESDIEKIKEELIEKIEGYEGNTRWKFRTENKNGLYFRPPFNISDSIRLKITCSDYNLVISGVIKTSRRNGLLSSCLDNFLDNTETMLNLVISEIINQHNIRVSGKTEHQGKKERELRDDNLTEHKTTEAKLSSLKKLKELYDAKVLTKKEFEEKKKKLLDTI
ncbi:hypothetical protein GF336_00585 [Candidatus Woesearchaeota archaeon]|nr:hypothetical protein [Candidatus Woesearchaeota archaeon]